MHLARVTGTVVATQKVEGMEGVRLLLVEEVDGAGNSVGKPLVAADAAQSGVGELVYVVTGREGAMALPEPFVPVDLAIVGHVDDVFVTPVSGEAWPSAAVAEGPTTEPKRRARKKRK